MEEIYKFVIEDLWEVVTTPLNSDKKLNLMVEAISKFFKVEKCSLMMEKEGKFKVVASVGLNKKVIEDTEIQAGQGISGMAVKEKKAIFMRKVNVIKNHNPFGEYKTDNFISYPIESKGKIIGVLNLTDKKDRGFNERDVELITPIIERIRFVLEKCIDESHCVI